MESWWTIKVSVSEIALSLQTTAHLIPSLKSFEQAAIIQDTCEISTREEGLMTMLSRYRLRLLHTGHRKNKNTHAHTHKHIYIYVCKYIQ